MKLIKTTFILLLVTFTTSIFADGKAVFKKKCGVCHALNGVSNGKMGPDLTGFAAKRPAEYLKLYMENPGEAKARFPDIYNKEVKGKYSSLMPKTKVSEADAAAILEALK